MTERKIRCLPLEFSTLSCSELRVGSEQPSGGANRLRGSDLPWLRDYLHEAKEPPDPEGRSHCPPQDGKAARQDSAFLAALQGLIPPDSHEITSPQPVAAAPPAEGLPTENQIPRQEHLQVQMCLTREGSTMSFCD